MNVFCTFATAECFAGDSVPAMVGAGTNNKGVHTVGDRAKTVYALIGLQIGLILIRFLVANS